MHALKSRAFSLIELVIVVVIIGIIAAIAIPRFSQGSERASANAIRANTAIIQNAIELYRAEHAGELPASLDSTKLNEALLLRSALDHTTGALTASTTDFPFGPYLREIPLHPGRSANPARLAVGTTFTGDEEWLFNPDTGTVTAAPNN